MTEPDDWSPLDPADHARQIDALLARLGALSRPALVIDLGAGGGRVAGPLADAGHRVLAIDDDPAALDACAVAGARTRRADLLDPAAPLDHPDGPADAVLCLGNTLALVHDVERAVTLLGRAARATGPGGWFAIDALAPTWEDVASGAWREGCSEAGDLQLVWAASDAVIVLRPLAADADPADADWTVRPDDRPLRLWSMGALRLLAIASGWGAPREIAAEHLTVFDRPPPGG